ncbi:MAG: serine acetyltransferase [Clostridia bacterium]|nr:serine acetyltransferase [Clostridia bacterium]
MEKNQYERIICSLENQGGLCECGGVKMSKTLPEREEIIRIIRAMRYVMFPKLSAKPELYGDTLATTLENIHGALYKQIFLAVCDTALAQQLTDGILEQLPDIKCALLKDVRAIYEGDPAAQSPDEVVLCYPGFTAIFVYRLAHEFYIRNIPYIPRIMTEYSHSVTGVDIHAGATIGEYFFIDHGTGIVIGETATIGSHVKIYQGVTIGAKSFELDADGNPVKGIKRHPDIGDNCIIYANATILGGNTRVGDGSVIGANVWLTASTPAGTKLYYTTATQKEDKK